MINNTDIQLLEDYIDGVLSGEALEALETRLNNDSELQSKLEQRKKIAFLWQAAEEYENTKQLIGNTLKAENKTTIGFFLRKNYYLLGVAASFLLLFGIYWFLIRQPNKGVRSSNSQIAVSADTLTMQQDIQKKYAKINYVFQLLAPVNNQIFSNNEPLIFQWKDNGANQTVILVIKDSTGLNTIFRQTISSHNSSFTLNPGKLKPGSYQWFINDSLSREYFTISK